MCVWNVCRFRGVCVCTDECLGVLCRGVFYGVCLGVGIYVCV